MVQDTTPRFVPAAVTSPTKTEAHVDVIKVSDKRFRKTSDLQKCFAAIERRTAGGLNTSRGSSHAADSRSPLPWLYA